MSRCRGERVSTSCGHFLCLLFQGYSVEAQVFPFLKIQAWGQGDGSAVKSVIVLTEDPGWIHSTDMATQNSF